MGSIDNAYISVLASLPKGGGKTKVKWRLGEIFQTYDGSWIAIAVKNVTPVWSIQATDWSRVGAYGSSIEDALLKLSEKLKRLDDEDGS